MYIVIGGGAAGCAAAFRLRRKGHEVVLLESEGVLGGRTRTEQLGKFRVEAGAIYLLNSYQHCLALLAESGHSDDIIAWSPLAGLYDGQRLHPVRYDFLPTYLRLPLLSARDKLRLVTKSAELMVRQAPDPFETDSLAEYDDGENMETWGRRELGDGGFEYVVRPLIEPLFGVDARTLSTPYLRGIMKRAAKARFKVPRAGMSTVCAGLTEGADVRLVTRAVSIDLGPQAVSVHLESGSTLQAEGVVIATDAVVAADLLEGALPNRALEQLRAVSYSSMAHVALMWDKDPWPEHRTEMILPVGPGPRHILGAITRTAATSELVPSGSRLTNLYFSNAATRELTPESLVAEATALIRRVYQSDAEPTATHVFRSDRSLALCPPGHYRRMQHLRAQLPGRVALAGDYLAHLGVETAVVSGEQAVHKLLGDRAPYPATR